jgi:hypothetical protein
LVVETRIASRDEAAGKGAQGRQLGSSAGLGGKTAENASDIAVESGSGVTKSDAGNGPGGVVADARKFLQGAGIGRQLPSG